MSKTFKALQRAAQERAQKRAEEQQDRQPQAPKPMLEVAVEERPASPPPPPHRLEPPPPPQAKPKPIAGARPKVPAPPPRKVTPTPIHEPVAPPPAVAQAPLAAPGPTPVSQAETAAGISGEADPLLVGLLAAALESPGTPSPLISPEGLVTGPQDAKRAATLLQKHSLLHCVKLGDASWRWFWGNRVQSEAYASQHDFPLDKTALL